MLSIIIPTLQVNIVVLKMLLNQLINEKYVDEIIVIDNSKKGISIKNEKLKIIIPKKNLYVNPAWNLGVKKSKNKYIGIVNDDLIFPNNFFRQIIEFFKIEKNANFVGLETIPKTDFSDFQEYPADTDLVFNKIEERCLCWGSAMFFKKDDYKNIPEKMKIWCGDDYLFYSYKNNYAIGNSNVKHLHSLTSDMKIFDEIKVNDQRIYKKLNPEYNIEIVKKNSIIQKIFSVKNLYINGTKIKQIYFLGFKFIK